MGYEDNYLMHHGIKGMHWGVRRFRNYDGTLTSAGKAQRRAQSSGGGSSRGGMSSTTKKRLATAAKVAGAAAAVGGAAYLANRASGGQLARDAKFNARYAKEVARDAVDRVADTKAGLAVRRGVGKAARRVGDTVSDRTADVRNRLANTRAGKAYDDFRAQGGIRGAASDARKGIRSAASNARDRVSSAADRVRTRTNRSTSSGKRDYVGELVRAAREDGARAMRRARRRRS